ncbi:LLM class flavin-dependent oxidoreductase [Nocardia fluminea]|uniref:LLM class flavin-dependent oxidoreductase n=1 Tax=Nocardia fluminea TaxID=134984 RepID=UPI00366FB894
MVLRHGVYLPPFGELADPRVLAENAVEAENADYDGVFVWDHVARPRDAGLAGGDAWIGLAAIAAATSRVVFGPRVTPLARRRPQDMARAKPWLSICSATADSPYAIERFGGPTGSQISMIRPGPRVCLRGRSSRVRCRTGGWLR